MTTALVALTSKLALTLGMGDANGTELVAVLKATAFKTKDPISDAQLTALLVIANQYGLNPWTKEIYAFPDKNNGIVPVVGVDGWARIINTHGAFDGMDFEQDPDGCTCVMYRKDRGHPIKVREYMVECARPGIGPWDTHPWRMLRHKAMIQCARLAFGFGGIYDPDEAERIIEAGEPKNMGAADVVKPAPLPRTTSADPKVYTDAEFEQHAATWVERMHKASKSAEDLALFLAGKGASMTPEQVKKLQALYDKEHPATTGPADVEDATIKGERLNYAQITDRMNAATTPQEVADAQALGAHLPEQQQKELQALADSLVNPFGEMEPKQ